MHEEIWALPASSVFTALELMPWAVLREMESRVACPLTTGVEMQPLP